MPVGGPGPFARGRTQFYRSHSNKNKVATHNGKAPRSHREAGKEPPRSHQGAHFWDPGPLGCSRKNHRIRTTDGTREMRGSNTPWAQGPANFWTGFGGYGVDGGMVYPCSGPAHGEFPVSRGTVSRGGPDTPAHRRIKTAAHMTHWGSRQEEA